MTRGCCRRRSPSSAFGAPVRRPAPGPKGYLAEALPDTCRILPPAPVPGSTRYEADRTTFLAARKLEGSARWQMAKADDSSIGILKGMACALGAELTRENAPKTYALFSRVGLDVGRPPTVRRTSTGDSGPTSSRRHDLPGQVGSAREEPRLPVGPCPLGLDGGPHPGRGCARPGHRCAGPRQAFGDSRLVCGVHNLSAVEAGRTNGSIVVAALHGQEPFRKDLEAVRKEIAAVRKAGPAPDPAVCAAEAELVAWSPY